MSVISPLTIIFLVTAAVFHAVLAVSIAFLVLSAAWELLLAWGRVDAPQ